MSGEPCDAAIRPFVSDTEIRCAKRGVHERHRGSVRDYAYPGSTTEVSWFEEDRRTYHGDWPGLCPSSGCVLPVNHRSGHAT